MICVVCKSTISNQMLYRKLFKNQEEAEKYITKQMKSGTTVLTWVVKDLSDTTIFG